MTVAVICCTLFFTTTTTVLRPFIRDYPGEMVPEETFLRYLLGFLVQGKITEADTPLACHNRPVNCHDCPVYFINVPFK